jgi:hypothetical protein
VTADDIASDLMANAGVGPFSIISGQRLRRMLQSAAEQGMALADIPRDIGRRTLRFTDEDWALSFDEESGEEAWWITLELLDPEQRGDDIVDHLAELSLSDVEAERLIGHLQDMIATGRRRFR